MGQINKKILIATGIYPPDIGGPATILPLLTNDLSAAGLEVRVLTYAEQGGITNGVYRVQRRGKFGQLEYFLKMFLLSFWAEVIYVTDIYSVGYFAWLLKKIFRRKYIVRFAGDAAWETAVANSWTSDYIIDFEKKKYNSKIEKLKNRRRKILCGADKVVAVSKFLAELARLIGVKSENIVVIYNAVDFVSPTVDLSRVAAIRQSFSGKKLIVTVCRLVPWKGVAGLIKIMPEIEKAVGPIAFLVLGDGPELVNLKKLTAELKVKDVYFLGKISQVEILDYIKAAEVFVLNTNYEGMSHALMEAMSVGTPVVSTNVGGNPELITNEKNGFLVGYNDLTAFGANIIRLLSDPDLAMRTAAAEQAKMQTFKWSETVAATVALLKNV